MVSPIPDQRAVLNQSLLTGRRKGDLSMYFTKYLYVNLKFKWAFLRNSFLDKLLPGRLWLLIAEWERHSQSLRLITWPQNRSPRLPVWYRLRVTFEFNLNKNSGTPVRRKNISLFCRVCWHTVGSADSCEMIGKTIIHACPATSRCLLPLTWSKVCLFSRSCEHGRATG